MTCAQLPSEIATELIDCGVATRTPVTRSGIPFVDLAVTGLGVATTVITFAQGPGAFEDISTRIACWRHRKSLASNPVISVNIENGRRSLSLSLTGSVDARDVKELLSNIAATMLDDAGSSERSPQASAD